MEKLPIDLQNLINNHVEHMEHYQKWIPIIENINNWYPVFRSKFNPLEDTYIHRCYVNGDEGEFQMNLYGKVYNNKKDCKFHIINNKIREKLGLDVLYDCAP